MWTPTGKPLLGQFWSPRPDLQSRANVANDADGAALQLASADFTSFGKWIAKYR
jgi:hypothetical protein